MHIVVVFFFLSHYTVLRTVTASWWISCFAQRLEGDFGRFSGRARSKRHSAFYTSFLRLRRYDSAPGPGADPAPCPGPGLSPSPGAMWHPGRPQLWAQTSHKPYAIDFLRLLCLFARVSCRGSTLLLIFIFIFIYSLFFCVAFTYFRLTRLVSSVMQVNLFAASDFLLLTHWDFIYICSIWWKSRDGKYCMPLDKRLWRHPKDGGGRKVILISVMKAASETWPRGNQLSERVQGMVNLYQASSS